jgi:transcriptional regulator with XRE-family HTH domain
LATRYFYISTSPQKRRFTNLPNEIIEQFIMRLKLLNKRLRDLRVSLGLSQEAMGSKGFISTPGWVKIENATRHPSDELINKMCDWLEKEGHVDAAQKKALLEELLCLKYMDNLSPFVSRLASDYYKTLVIPNILRVPVKAIDPDLARFA